MGSFVFEASIIFCVSLFCSVVMEIILVVSDNILYIHVFLLQLFIWKSMHVKDIL